jgi:hypothetical protein
MSLRARFQPQAPAPRRGEGEAAEALLAQRGRAPIQPAPKASRAVAKLIRDLAPQGGIGLGEMKRRWADLVSEPFASKTAPETFAGGVLTIRAPSALAPLLQSELGRLAEQLRLGGAKVREIRLMHRQAPIRKSNVAPLKSPLSPLEEAAVEAALEADLQGVENPSLKAALKRLGRAVKQR